MNSSYASTSMVCVSKNLRAVPLKAYHFSPNPTCRAIFPSVLGGFIGQVRISKNLPSLKTGVEYFSAKSFMYGESPMTKLSMWNCFITPSSSFSRNSNTFLIRSDALAVGLISSSMNMAQSVADWSSATCHARRWLCNAPTLAGCVMTRFQTSCGNTSPNSTSWMRCWPLSLSNIVFGKHGHGCLMICLMAKFNLTTSSFSMKDWNLASSLPIQIQRTFPSNDWPVELDAAIAPKVFGDRPNCACWASGHMQIDVSKCSCQSDCHNHMWPMDPLYMLKILKAQQASQSIQYKNLKDCWELIHEICDVFPVNQYMLPILGTASLTTLPCKWLHSMSNAQPQWWIKTEYAPKRHAHSEFHGCFFSKSCLNIHVFSYACAHSELVHIGNNFKSWSFLFWSNDVEPFADFGKLHEMNCEWIQGDLWLCHADCEQLLRLYDIMIVCIHYVDSKTVDILAMSFYVPRSTQSCDEPGYASPGHVRQKFIRTLCRGTVPICKCSPQDATIANH